MSGVTTGSVRPASKCDMVVQRLQDMIIRGDYHEGDRLPTEDELCEMFGVSRITVREALKKLSMIGMVSVRQGKGTFVKGVNLGHFIKPMFQLIDFDQLDVGTIYDARLYVEVGTARCAAERRSPEDIAAMHTTLERFRTALEEGDLAAVAELDTLFHIGIAKAGRNSLLEATLVTLEEITSACRKRLHNYLIAMSGAQEHHDQILDAIERGDPDAAEQCIRIHTLQSKELLVRSTDWKAKENAEL